MISASVMKVLISKAKFRSDTLNQNSKYICLGLHAQKKDFFSIFFIIIFINLAKFKFNSNLIQIHI